LEALAGTEEILAMLAVVVKETAIRLFHVNVPEINFKGERHRDPNYCNSTKHREGL
jgi:hypothetical protein